MVTRSVIRRWSVCVSWIHVASATARRFREPIHNSQTTDPRGYAVAIGKRCPPALAHLTFVPLCVTQRSTGSRRNVRGTPPSSKDAIVKLANVEPRSGRSQRGELIQEPVCIRVVGNTAYISMITVKTYDDNFSRVGDKGVYWVQGGGKDGADVAYGGPAFFWDPTDAICTSTPPDAAGRACGYRHT